MFVTANASVVLVVTAAVVSLPPATFALILTEPSVLYTTSVLSPFTIFAWYLTTVFAGLPELWSAAVCSIVALVPLPFWNSTMSLFLTSE